MLRLPAAFQAGGPHHLYGVKSIKNDLDSLKKKTALLEQASEIGDVAELLGLINAQSLRINDLVPQVNVNTTGIEQLKTNFENIQNQSA